jgi:hypothetical protein
MKVLLIGKHNMLYWLEHTKEAFETTKSIEVSTVEVNRLGFVDDLTRNINKLFSQQKAYDTVSRALERHIQTFQPDLILVISPFLLNAKVFACFDAAPEHTVKAGWVGDIFKAGHKEIAECFDLLYCTDSSFIDLAATFGFPPAKYLPLAVNERLFNDLHLKREEELLFIRITNETADRFDKCDRYDACKSYRKGLEWLGH